MATALALAASGGPACASRDGDGERISLDTSLYALVETVDGFDFYAPLGPQPVVFSGVHQPGLLDRLEVRLESTSAEGATDVVATFTGSTDPRLREIAEHEVYFVNVPAAAYFTDPTRAYRFRVLFGGHELGFSDMSDRVFQVLAAYPDLRVGVMLRIESLAVDRDGDGIFDVDEIPDGSTPELAGTDCASIQRTGVSADGYYWIDADGDGSARAPVRVFCDLTTDGGGWMLVARASETNGAGGDYEFSAAFGQRSLLGVGFTGGTPESAQYTQALDSVVAPGAHTVELQYVCQDTRNPAATRYWATVRGLDFADLHARLSASNPDFLLSGASIDNADGVTSSNGYYAFFARETIPNQVNCGNGYAGQSGIKFSCAQSGQTVMNPRSVWMLTHYAGFTYSEVTSCGSAAGNVMPYYAGEVRLRAHSCEDGLHDARETDVDCGGVCGGCAVGAMCNSYADCESNSCEGGVCQAPRCDDGAMNGDELSIDCGGSCGGACVHLSCQTVLQAGRSAGSGEYWLDADGLGPGAPFRASCDMDTDGGGWTLLARASDTNGAGGDYEFRARFGQHSLLGRSYSGGRPADTQYTLALETAVPSGTTELELQYACYDTRDRAGTFYWTKGSGLPVAELVSLLTPANPDFLRSSTRIENLDGDVATGMFAVFGRETSGDARCGNGYAGQSGFKYTCAQSGQTVMSPRSVWMLTHYENQLYSEVTSCGSRAGNVMPYFAGEVRFREQNCANGIQDGSESAIDCGGPCAPCAAGLGCERAIDCDSRVCTGGVCQAARCDDGVTNGGETSIDCGGSCGTSCPALSCASLLAGGRSYGTGEYTVDPDGAGPNAPIRVWCDMTTDGGGWTLLARASDTNGAGGDYEFRAAFGQQSLLTRSFSGGALGDAQYTLAAELAIPGANATIDLQYLCYDSRDRAGTQYWARVRNLSRADLLSRLGAANPDFLLSNVSVVNADGVSSTTGNYAFFAREIVSNHASCGNGYAGQSGIKYSCAQSGQTVMSPRGVWLLTHYGSYGYTEVTSCGSRAGNVMPYFVGEVRFR